MTAIKISRRQALGAAAGVALSPIIGRAASQAYPNKPIRLIVANPLGTGLDIDSRFWANLIGQRLGRPVYVENKPGAATTIGTALVAKAPADGYTLLMGIPSSLCYMAELYKQLPYQPTDFDAISQLSASPCGIVAHPSVPVTNATELVELARANPDGILAGTVGVGTFQHLLGEWFGSVTHSQYKYVPFNTTSPYTALLGGQIQVMFDALPASASNLRAGKLKPLAINGKTRSQAFPSVPTCNELGIHAFEPTAWIGLMAPTGTPLVVRETLARACADVARSPEIAQRYQDLGVEAIGNSPIEFAAIIDAERAKWTSVVKRSGIKLSLS